jgi:hypothetical protein
VLLQVYDAVKAEIVKRGAYIMTPQQCRQAGCTIIKEGRINADVVGKKPSHLAALFGFSVPAGTKVLIGEVAGIGAQEPMSYEKLCPVLGEWVWKSLCFVLCGSAAGRWCPMLGESAGSDGIHRLVSCTE